MPAWLLTAAARAAPTPGSAWRANLFGLRLFLLLHMAARSCLGFPRVDAGLLDQIPYAAAVGVAALGCAPRFTRRVMPVAAGLVIAQLIGRILAGADTANHVFLEAVFLTFFAICSVEDDEESILLLQCVRWTVAIFFFYTGLQKVLYGYYFDGQFLAFMAATSDHFKFVFQHAIPAEELARLEAFNAPSPTAGSYRAIVGAGPYTIDSPLFMLLSNSVYVFEMAAAMLLMVPKRRAFAALAAIAFVVAIEAGARELSFGALMINLLLIFTDGPWIRRLLPLFAVFYGYLLLAENGGLGILPMFSYAPA